MCDFQHLRPTAVGLIISDARPCVASAFSHHNECAGAQEAQRLPNWSLVELSPARMVYLMAILGAPRLLVMRAEKTANVVFFCHLRDALPIVVRPG